MVVSVIAVVVTYNRRLLLAKCLEALQAQAGLSKIIVINNASTDGTHRLLDERGYLASLDIEYHELPENIGGAGGFSFGLAKALVHDPDYFWLMDDDGLPGPLCLMSLLSAGGDIVAPLVVDVDDPEHAAFPYAWGGGRTKDVSVLKSHAMLTPVHPFNGVMISRAVVKKIGVPDQKFFIWGDELDYRGRWLEAGFQEQVITEARFFHPADRQVIYRKNQWSIGVPIAASRLRKFCFYRNQLWLSKRRIGVFRSLLKALLTLPDVVSKDTDYDVFLWAVLHGLLGIEDGHKKYLR